MILLLTVTIALTGSISFLCSLTEAVLLSLNPLSLQLQSQRGERDAARWLLLKQQIERPISAILVFNTLATTGLATLAGALFTGRFGHSWLWLFTLLLSAAVIFGGELAPKIIGVHHTEKIAPRLIGPLCGIIRGMAPLLHFMERFCRRFKPSGAAASQGSDRIMDIITLVEAARAEQVLHSREEIIMIHAATLSARQVRTAMVPVSGVAFFDLRLGFQENILALGPQLHRSYPVTRDGTAGGICGTVRVRELFYRHLAGTTSPQPTPFDWKESIRPVLHMEEKGTLTQLLALFLDRSEIAALVDDRQGQVSGWITMDDVMKVLMGQRI